jgi:ATP-dependent Clp protease ATP-binding subunit ClpA
MTKLLHRLSRYSPLFMAAFGILAILQLIVFVYGFAVSSHPLAWAANHARALGWTFAAAALFCVLLAEVVRLHAADRLPPSLRRWRLLMDVLDRLTNRKELERLMKPKPEAVYIDADALAQSLKRQVVGQDAICEEVAVHIRRRLAKLAREKPVAVFLFAGPPGVGKTYLGKVLGRELKRPVLHIDMTRFSSAAHAAPSLFGAQKSYVGSDTYGKITGGLREHPDAVVLLDEFEKAHNSVHKNFLTAWNDGFVTEASTDEQISTAAAIFVLTTNAAVEPLMKARQECADNPDGLRPLADAALRAAGFAPEVLSRIDRIFVFDRLGGLDIARVAALEIETVIEGYGLKVDSQGIDPQVLVDLMERQQTMGAAASSRDVLRAVEESIADALIEAKRQGAQTVSLKVEGDRVRAVPGRRAERADGAAG